MSNLSMKDLGSGVLFIAVGLTFVVYALITLELGRVGNMGPGYFPVLLGAILVILGIGLVLRSPRSGRDTFGAAPWKGLLLTAAALVFFALTVRPLGMWPALFGGVFLASLATERIRWPLALIVSAVLSVACVGVFIYALGLPYAVFGPWIRGY